MSDLDPNYEWHEIHAFGSAQPRFVRGACNHLATVPVESGGEQVASLCLKCDAQLPPRQPAEESPVTLEPLDVKILDWHHSQQ